ncbi:hypothetical protein LX32DRAFT_227791 [Colletotrichum zoysiae]|uniref:Uncharacterized protein n=1 Tax=Colletotrichum zoysiae TaxID=1216348 RepID=A0AAD9HPL2_9PEZI|nr:hypothetical protein LX32DRAFT_227791 [Colletotrichum zoysiae]
MTVSRADTGPQCAATWSLGWFGCFLRREPSNVGGVSWFSQHCRAHVVGYCVICWRCRYPFFGRLIGAAKWVSFFLSPFPTCSYMPDSRYIPPTSHTRAPNLRLHHTNLASTTRTGGWPTDPWKRKNWSSGREEFRLAGPSFPLLCLSPAPLLPPVAGRRCAKGKMGSKDQPVRRAQSSRI